MKLTVVFSKVCSNYALFVLCMILLIEAPSLCQTPLSATGSRIASRNGEEEKETTTIYRVMEELRQMRQVIDRLEKRIGELEAEKRAGMPAQPEAKPLSVAAGESVAPARESKLRPPEESKDSPVAQEESAGDRKVLDFFQTTTFNLMIDGYYGYNFNKPVGRINLLRAYDVLSNSF